MLLYHTGFAEIKTPDLRRGRPNADFGQGFYLSDDPAFAERWATEKKGVSTIVNRYDLHTDGLRIKRFERGDEWFRYIFSNRHRKPDMLEDYDLIIGPIANDTLYNTWGVLTSGLLEDAQALDLLQLGPAYQQVVVKSEKAAAALQWLGAKELDRATLQAAKALVAKEEAAFQSRFAARIADLLGADAEDLS